MVGKIATDEELQGPGVGLQLPEESECSVPELVAVDDAASLFSFGDLVEGQVVEDAAVAEHWQFAEDDEVVLPKPEVI